MKTILLSLLLGFALFSLSSCSKSNPTGPSGNMQILPLKVGNTWIMQYTGYDTTGAALGTVYDTATVASDTVVSGVTWYHVSSLVIDGLFANKSDGLWGLGPTAGGSVVLKYPANAGDTWNVQADASTNYTVVLQSDSASVTVPKGTYSCYDYKMIINSEPEIEVYMCPGVGFVAMALYSVTNSGRSYKQAYGELTSLTLK